MSKIIQPQGVIVRSIEIKMDNAGRSTMVAKDSMAPGGMMPDLVQMQILSQMLAHLIAMTAQRIAMGPKRISEEIIGNEEKAPD